MKPLRVSTFQRRPQFDNMPSILDRLSTDLAICDQLGIKLALFPECYLQGYASDRATIQRLAISTDDQAFLDLLSLSANFQTSLIIGFIERKGDFFYNSAAIINKGVLEGCYSKIHTNEPGFDPGHTYPVFACGDCALAVNICNDANFSTTARQFSVQGIQLLCYPLNNMLALDTAARWRSKSVENLRQRAIDTGCWVMSSDVVGEVGGKISYGCTCIVSPDGTVMVQADESVEGQLVHDLS